MPRSKKDTLRIIDVQPEVTGGGSLRSQSVTVVPPPSGNIAKPTNLQAANGGIARSPVKPEAYINLTWRAPIGIVPTYYEIEYGRSSEWNNTTKTFSDPQRVVSYNVAATISVGLKTFYRFRVRAVHRNVVSQWTDTVEIESEDDAVATAPVSSPAGTWDSLTGDLTITWTNPTDVNFRDVRLRIYESSAQATLYRTVFVTGQSYIYTRAQNISDSTGGDPSIYVILEARSWASSGTVYSTPVNLTTTLSVPANVTLVAGSPTFDFVTGSATWRWNAAARASYYKLTIDNIDRDVYSTTYTYSAQQNTSEHSGTADNVLSWEIVGVDAFGQVSTTATSDTATLNDPGTVQNVSATWNGATGECTWKWDALANTTGYRLTIDNVARTVTGTSYTYTLDQNRAEHNSTADPTLSWSIVGVNGLGRVSPTAVTGTATLSPPAQPQGLTLNFTAPDLVVNWTASTSVVGYRMEVDNLSREIGYTNRYVYTLAQNRIEHSGVADATLDIELWAIDALGQISTSAATASATAPAPTQPDAVTLQVYFDVLTATVAHTRTVFTEFYQYRVTIGGTTTTDPAALTVLTDNSNILLDSSSPAQQLGYETGSNYNALIPQSIYSVAIIVDGSYQVHVAEVDVFGRTSTETSSNIAIADALTLEELRAEAKYTDSLTPPTPDQQLKQVLADDNLTSPGVAYTSGSTYRWTQMSRALLERYRTITAGLFSPTNTQFYFATSIDGSNWKWFAGSLTNVTAAGATLAEQPDQSAAESNAISASSASLTTRWDLPVIVEARFVRLYHRNTTSNYTIAEFYPRRLVQSDDIEAESIKAINIAAKTISAAQISARSITGDEIDVNTITVTNLNFTPVQTGNVVASINASTEGIRIAGNRITVDGDVTFAASYDPSTKITTGGAAADVNANVTTISGGKITTGSITATQIQAGSITGDKISSATTITAGTGNNVGVLDGADLTWRIYAGNATPSSAPFRVSQSGALTATNATITGNITVTGGNAATTSYVDTAEADANTYANTRRITGVAGTWTPTGPGAISWTGVIIYRGDGSSVSITNGTATGFTGQRYLYWTTTSTVLSVQTTPLTGANDVLIAVVNSGAALASIRVVAGITAISGDMINTGTITATQIAAGTITGNEISSATTITAGSGDEVAVLNGLDGNLTDGANDLSDGANLLRENTWRIYAGNANPNLATFRVESDGTMTATNAIITGGELFAGAGAVRLGIDGLHLIGSNQAGSQKIVFNSTNDNSVANVIGYINSYLDDVTEPPPTVRSVLNIQTGNTGTKSEIRLDAGSTYARFSDTDGIILIPGFGQSTFIGADGHALVHVGGVGLELFGGDVDIATNSSYMVNGINVVKARRTGWGAPSGTATRTAFATGSVTLSQLAERVKALIDDLTTHGLIGPTP